MYLASLKAESDQHLIKLYNKNFCDLQVVEHLENESHYKLEVINGI